MSNISFHESENISLYLDNLTLIDQASSSLQNVQLFMHPQLGKVLIINDEVQHIERWIPYYHEAIVHIPIMFLKSPERVLILGGGDLFAAFEALKYTTVKKVVLCDYDENVISLTEKYYSHARSVLSDSRFNLVIQDARDYIKTCNEKFDLIIDDCFNLVNDFDSSSIFSILKSLLSPDGLCSSLIYRHVFDSEIMRRTYYRLINQHKTVLSLVTVPEYPGILHLLTIWGTSKNLSQELTESINIEHGVISSTCGLFNSKFCRYYLYLPNYIKAVIKEF